MKKAKLEVEVVEKLYKQTGKIKEVCSILGTSTLTLCRFMDENGIKRKKPFDPKSVSKEQLLEDYRQLNNLSKIATKYGISKNTVRRMFYEKGISVNLKLSPKRFVNLIRYLTDKGLNSFEIAEQLGISPGHLNEIAKDHGVKLIRRYHKGFITTHNGYRKTKDVSSDDADSKGYVYEHRAVLAKALNIDAIPKDYVVHHINGDKTDNSPDNLEMMTRSDHSKLHRHANKI